MIQNFQDGSVQAQYVSPPQAINNTFYGLTVGIIGGSGSSANTKVLYYIQGTGGVDTYSICYTTGIGQQATFITQDALVSASGNVNWVKGTDVIQNIIFDPTLGFNNGKMYILTNKYIFTADYMGKCTMVVDILANSSSVGNYGMAFDNNNNLYYTTKSSVDGTTSIFKLYTIVNSMSWAPNLISKSDVGSAIQYFALAVDVSEVVLKLSNPQQYLLVTQGNNVIRKTRLSDGVTMANNFPATGVTKYGNIAVNPQTGTIYADVYNSDNSIDIKQYTCDGNPLPITTVLPNGTPYNANSSNIVSPIVGQVISVMTVGNNGTLYFTDNERSRISYYNEVIAPVHVSSFYAITIGDSPDLGEKVLYYVRGNGGVESYSIWYTQNGTSVEFITQREIQYYIPQWVIGQEVIQNIIFNPNLTFAEGYLYVLTTNYILAITLDKKVYVPVNICRPTMILMPGTSNYGMTFDTNNNLYFTNLSESGLAYQYGAINSVDTTANIDHYLPVTNIYTINDFYFSIAIDSSEIYSNKPNPTQWLYSTNGTNIITKTDLTAKNQQTVYFPTTNIVKYTNIIVNQTTGYVYAIAKYVDGTSKLNQYDSNGNPVNINPSSSNGLLSDSNNTITPLSGQSVSGLAFDDRTQVIYLTNDTNSQITFYNLTNSTPTPVPTPPGPTPDPTPDPTPPGPYPTPSPDPYPEPSPYGNVCFPSNTPILTDQGIIPIQKINTYFHTINNKRIVAITKSMMMEKYLVYFEPHSLKKNYPSQKTIISGEHKIKFNGKMTEARKFIGSFNGVKLAKYNGQILYNILLDTHETISVNGLICETLNPNNAIAKLYDGSMDNISRIQMINEINHKAVKNELEMFKKSISKNRLK
jgi:hypothetical protein